MTPEAIVEFTEALARIAATGGGPKALAAYLAQRAEGGVLLEDARWRHLAAAGSGPIPATARATVEGNAPGRAVRVAAGARHAGWLSLFGGNHAADADTLLRLTAAAIGVELARDATGARARTEDFWGAMLDGAYHDAAAARAAADAHGIALAACYITVVLEAEAGVAQLRSLLPELLRGSGGETGACERGASLFIFMPAARAVDASNAKTAASLLPKSLARRAPELRVSGGIGTIEPFSALARGAAAAQAALAIGRRMYGSGHVVSYEDLGAYALVYEGADTERLRAFAFETLAPLRNYDEKHQTELVRTLRLYFKVGQNVKTAAGELNVHRHTVFYRLRQIAEISGRSLESSHDQLALRLAVAIDELHDSI